jgi:hypothetical protein
VILGRRAGGLRLGRAVLARRGDKSRRHGRGARDGEDARGRGAGRGSLNGGFGVDIVIIGGRGVEWEVIGGCGSAGDGEDTGGSGLDSGGAFTVAVGLGL